MIESVRDDNPTSGATVVGVSREGFLRTGGEHEAAEIYARLFEQNSEPTTARLSHFVKDVRRQDMTRLLARYEIFKRVLSVKGSIIECGVFRGSGLMPGEN